MGERDVTLGQNELRGDSICYSSYLSFDHSLSNEKSCVRNKHWLAFKSLQAKKRRKRNNDENYLTCLFSFSV